MTPTSSTGLSITCNDLGKRFNREWIFRRLSYTFEPGNIYAITGPNGSGKSTLLQILWGQSPPTVGKIAYQLNNTDVPVEEIFNHVSIATPYMDLIDEFTLEEQLRFHFKLKTPYGGITIDELMERMYLTHAHDKFIGNFSSGMRQRVKLALAFYTKSDMIFLDEPGTNLDKQAFEWYCHQLKNANPNALILIASNNAEEYPVHAHLLNIMAFK
ncbi:MAG TPA: ATP-binding cassette domain-containing protein [Ohtaekwangia sp.]|nr:ATP-binding cassette domain-containing protein [Ohtaekwangia sp.]